MQFSLASTRHPSLMAQANHDPQEYDITDTGCQVCLCLTCPLHFMPLIPGIMGTKTMTLEEEEVREVNPSWKRGL